VRQLSEAHGIQQATLPGRAEGFLHFARLFSGQDRRFAKEFAAKRDKKTLKPKVRKGAV
jgi:hypothetical protein